MDCSGCSVGTRASGNCRRRGWRPRTTARREGSALSLLLLSAIARPLRNFGLRFVALVCRERATHVRLLLGELTCGVAPHVALVVLVALDRLALACHGMLL